MSRQCLHNLPSRHIYKPFSLTLIPITPLPPLPHYPSLGCPIGSRSNRSHAQSGWLNACCCHAQSGCVTFILSKCPIGFWVMIMISSSLGQQYFPHSGAQSRLDPSVPTPYRAGSTGVVDFPHLVACRPSFPNAQSC